MTPSFGVPMSPVVPRMPVRSEWIFGKEWDEGMPQRADKSMGKAKGLFSSQQDQKQVGPRDCLSLGSAFCNGKRDAQKIKIVPTSWQEQPALPGSASFPTLAGESISPGARRCSVSEKFISACATMELPCPTTTDVYPRCHPGARAGSVNGVGLHRAFLPWTLPHRVPA